MTRPPLASLQASKLATRGWRFSLWYLSVRWLCEMEQGWHARTSIRHVYSYDDKEAGSSILSSSHHIFTKLQSLLVSCFEMDTCAVLLYQFRLQMVKGKGWRPVFSSCNSVNWPNVNLMSINSFRSSWNPANGILPAPLLGAMCLRVLHTVLCSLFIFQRV